MTVFELHLKVNQRYQEVASYKRRKFFPEEIDAALQIAEERQIQKLVDAYLQDRQLSLKAISPIIKKNIYLPIIIPSINDAIYEDNMVYSVIPHNLRYLLNSRTEILLSTVNCGVAPTLATTTLTEYTAVVQFPSGGGSVPYFTSFQVSRTAGTLYTAPTPYSSGFPSLNSKFQLIQASLDFFNNYVGNGFNLKVYWERYRDVEYPDSFIFVSDTNLGTMTVSCSGNSNSTAMVGTNYTTYDRTQIPNLTNTLVKYETPKLAEIDALYSMLMQNEYYNPTDEEPLINQTEDYFLAYKDKSFLITRVAIDYVRKPRKINLALNQTSELDESVHQKVVDLAVELLRLDTKDAAYAESVKDTDARNKI